MIPPRTIILAAGQGTRLRPFTDTRPKCMVELFGAPLIHHQLAVLRACGLEDIVVVNGYLRAALEAPDTRPVHNPDYDRTNMVASLFCAEAEMPTDRDLLIAYSDILYEPRVLQTLLANDAPLAIAADRGWRKLWQARMANPLADAETFKVNAAGCITELGRKPENYEDVQAQYIGLIKVRAQHVTAFRDAWHALPPEQLFDGRSREQMFMTSFLQHLIDRGWEARPSYTDNGWIEVDTVEDLERYRRMQAAGELQAIYQP
jgi:L-glutamine-phosphate cytidylyltransferase